MHPINYHKVIKSVNKFIAIINNVVSVLFVRKKGVNNRKNTHTIKNLSRKKFCYALIAPLSDTQKSINWPKLWCLCIVFCTILITSETRVCREITKQKRRIIEWWSLTAGDISAGKSKCFILLLLLSKCWLFVSYFVYNKNLLTPTSLV